MTRPPVRWAECELPEELSRLIASAAPSHHDDAAIARMRARLHESLGPAFQTRVPRSSTASRVLSVLQRGKWLCAALLATAGLSFLSLRSIERVNRTSREALRAGEQVQTSGIEAPAHVRAEPVLPAASIEPEPLPARAAAAVQSASAAPRGRRTVARAPSGLAAELQGLDEIRRLLQKSPVRALAAAVAQQERFARGALGPERELLRIEALLRMGRFDEARRAATSVLSASDNPPYREQIEKLFAQTPRSAERRSR